jgi:hypothetical protein
MNPQVTPQLAPDPNTQILEHILVTEAQNGADTKQLLENILVQGDKNDEKAILENSLLVNHDILQTLKENTAKTEELKQKMVEDNKNTITIVNVDTPNDIESIMMKGEQGKQGEQGIQGIPGANGKDYILTDDDKEQIKERVKAEIPFGLRAFSDLELEHLISEVSKLVPAGKNGKNGKNAVPLPAEQVDYTLVKNLIKDVISTIPKAKDIKVPAPLTAKQIKDMLVEEGFSYDDLKDKPNFGTYRGKIASKTVSLSELDDVNLSGLTQTNGKYNLGSGGGGSAWGSITGTLSAQTDLQTALNLKVNTTSFVDNEIVSGSATTFTLANTPIAGSVHVYGNGQRLTPGIGNDYTISGSTITIIAGSYTTGSVLADYRI